MKWKRKITLRFNRQSENNLNNKNVYHSMSLRCPIGGYGFCSKPYGFCWTKRCKGYRRSLLLRIYVPGSVWIRRKGICLSTLCRDLRIYGGKCLLLHHLLIFLRCRFIIDHNNITLSFFNDIYIISTFLWCRSATNF